MIHSQHHQSVCQSVDAPVFGDDVTVITTSITVYRRLDLIAHNLLRDVDWDYGTRLRKPTSPSVTIDATSSAAI